MVTPSGNPAGHGPAVVLDGSRARAVADGRPDDGLPGGGLVDVHTHAIAPHLPDLAAAHPFPAWPTVERTGATEARILVGGRPYREIDERCWSASRRVADMDAEGVALQVVSPIPITLCHDAPPAGAAALARAQNDFFADLVAHAPGRLAALGAVPLQDPPAACRELVRCMRDLSFLGVEIGTRAGERELCDPALDPFFATAAELGALVLVHPADRTLDPRLDRLGITFGAGMPMETATAAAGLLVRTAPLRPGLRLCLAHGGGALPALLPRLDRGQRLRPDGGPAPDDLPGARARSLWCDSLTYDAAGLLLAVHRFGADHVMLGTDYPFSAREVPPGAVLRQSHPDLTPELVAAVGRGNARRLIGRITAEPATSATADERRNPWEPSSASV